MGWGALCGWGEVLGGGCCVVVSWDSGVRGWCFVCSVLGRIGDVYLIV